MEYTKEELEVLLKAIKLLKRNEEYYRKSLGSLENIVKDLYIEKVSEGL